MSCYATDGGGWGVGGDDDVPCACTHASCYATDGVGGRWVGMMMFFALAHMCHATQLMGWLGVGGDDDVPCTCTHVSCYATDGVGGDDDVPCTCTHVSCYTCPIEHRSLLAARYLNKSPGLESQCVARIGNAQTEGFLRFAFATRMFPKTFFGKLKTPHRQSINKKKG